MSTETTFEALKKAVHDNNFKAFDTAYIDYLQQYPEFSKAYSEAPAEVRVTNPIFGQQSFSLHQTNNDQAHAILEKGAEASRVFGSLSVEERQEFLEILGKKIADHKQEIALTITADTGKPIDLSYQEMDKGGDWFAYAKDELVDQLKTKERKNGRTQHFRPMGVAQIIGAYNYPYALAAGGIVGALGGGNSIVVSAPMKAPNWVFPFQKAAKEAIDEFLAEARKKNKPWADGLDEVKGGLIQNSIGINSALTTQADIVHFVGSDTAGEFIRKSRDPKRTILEMGGTNVAVVMKSALETKKPEEIADKIYKGFGPATGQRCTAVRILCVENGAEAVSEAVKKICNDGPSEKEIGNPFMKGIKMGPLVDRGAHQKMQQAIALAKELGADVYGNLQVNPNVVPQAKQPDSYWVNPVAIDWSKVDMNDPDKAKRVKNCLQTEIFGPLLHIIHPVKDLQHAIDMTNDLDHQHKLAGAIFTNNHNDMLRYQQATRITSIMENEPPKDLSPDAPHGHPNLAKIGGDTHFRLYVDTVGHTSNLQLG